MWCPQIVPKIYEDNENHALECCKDVIWFKWCSFMEKFNRKKSQDHLNSKDLRKHCTICCSYFYAVHLFHFGWQAMQYERLRNTIQEDKVGAIIDFRQNINHRKQHEASLVITIEGNPQYSLFFASFNAHSALS